MRRREDMKEKVSQGKGMTMKVLMALEHEISSIVPVDLDD